MRAGALAPDAVAAIGAGAWLVGGAIRDELLGRGSIDVDIAVSGDAAPRARALARVVGGHAFALSEAFGAWRVTAAGRQFDLTPLVGGTLESDLARRDLTINAIARPLDGGPTVDPHGGVADVASRTLRMVGPDTFAQDPLRTLRLARLASDLGFAIDPATSDAARVAAPGLANISGERIFSEVRHILAGDGAVAGIREVVASGAAAVVLPELLALRGVGQSRYHHLDVYEHTLSVLAQTVALTGPGVDASDLGPAAGDVADVLAEPLANEMTRGQALRFAALMHDIAKPATRAVTGDGRVTFFGHDELGSTMSREILGRWRASEKLSAFVAALTRQHLRLGFLVHQMPLGLRDVYDYLAACEPVEVEVTVLSLADRRATAGAGSAEAIARHQLLVSEMLPAAVRWRRQRPRAPVRGDRLAAALGRRSGPWVGAAIDELAAATYAGEIDGEDAAIAHARDWLTR